MPETLADDSVGIIETQIAHFSEDLKLECGKVLSGYDIAYETYGELNADASNAILICHALSGDQHVAGFNSMGDKKPGWWDSAIGPGKAIDTNRFFVVCINNLGGCKGSSGPNTINPESGKYWGPDFPIVTVKDWVLSQYRFMLSLDISQWCAVVGGSLGGMQVIQWSIDYPDLIKHAIVIAAAPKLSAQNIAFNEVARQSIMSDPDFCEGHYLEKDTVPRRGLMLARMLGHITYLSDDAMRDKFGRELREGKLNFGFDVDFQVESYLRYQGRSFVDRFDANTYLLMTKTLDYFDPAAEYGEDLAAALKQTKAQFLVISFTSDWRFAPERSREIVKALLQAEKRVSYIEIEANQGHDAFLIPIPHYMNVFNSYMNNLAEELS
ncbi:Homoserine O-acetyltransferase [hydrothermal vent metagenome]|uniref:Homoserine O-acetyltransferase n=1 Tax=hydrothermal vent metagenome TaxID=652676 RepID=A0A3B0XG24_9ZZZZ